jgi:hypothetical protein
MMYSTAAQNVVMSVREGLNKNSNKIGGIFHGGLTPPPPLPLRWKIIKKMFNFLEMSLIGS